MGSTEVARVEGAKTSSAQQPNINQVYDRTVGKIVDLYQEKVGEVERACTTQYMAYTRAGKMTSKQKDRFFSAYNVAQKKK